VHCTDSVKETCGEALLLGSDEQSEQDFGYKPHLADTVSDLPQAH
jgi:hypothetical protein